jgi:glycosyltransferase involved in cell wall biosynthesis
MSVKDDEDFVAQSIESILEQDDINFEFIIVNDGSSDKTGDVIAEFQRADDRVKVIEQEHKGLTRALATGCKLAKGKYIARQDAGGDISLPDRLRSQFEILEDSDNAVMIGSGVRVVGPDGEFLYDSVISQDELDRGLESLSITNVKGPPSHCSTMMRSSAYLKIGGYRDAFYVAQDLDLWLRLYETGETIADEEIRYVVRVRPTDISMLYRKSQIKTTKVILEAARLRRAGRDDNAILNRVVKVRQKAPRANIIKKLNRNVQEARGLYHIGACINSTDSNRARHYYCRALTKQPFHLRALLRLVSTYLA